MTFDRRHFLTTTAALGASALWAATRSRAFAAEPRGVDDAALGDLRKRLGDRLVAPSDARYDVLRKVRNRDFDGLRPRAMVMAASGDDVRFALQWAGANKVPVVPRGGGHSYIGQSTSEGLVISLLGRAATRVDKRAMTAEIGAGALNVDANFGLLKEGVALPTGSCPSVGIAGLTLGGGIGFSSRKWGLMIDNLAGVTMVLASGEVLEIDAQHRPELLWARVRASRPQAAGRVNRPLGTEQQCCQGRSEPRVDACVLRDDATARLGRVLPELSRPRSRRLEYRLLRREPGPPRAGQGDARPDRGLSWTPGARPGAVIVLDNQK